MWNYFGMDNDWFLNFANVDEIINLIFTKEFNNFIGRCLTVDPKRRPTAKELLFDPFILMKNKGPALLSELVTRSLEDIEQFR